MSTELMSSSSSAAKVLLRPCRARREMRSVCGGNAAKLMRLHGRRRCQGCGLLEVRPFALAAGGAAVFVSGAAC